MHGTFEGGLSYTVTVVGGSGVEMRVERSEAEAVHVDKKSRAAGGPA